MKEPAWSQNRRKLLACKGIWLGMCGLPEGWNRFSRPPLSTTHVFVRTSSTSPTCAMFRSCVPA